MSDLPALHPQYAPRLNPRSDHDAHWEGEVTEQNVPYIRERLEQLLVGRAFTITRAYEYNGWELEQHPICRCRTEGDDAGVYVHMGSVQFAAANWHWSVPVGARLLLHRDRAQWAKHTPEGKLYRIAVVVLEDSANFNVVLEPEEAAVARALAERARLDHMADKARPLVEHIDRVFPGNERWL